MAISIQTNVASLGAQRHLSSVQATLDGALSRLSSGFRITRAGDDAAGLGISSKLEAQLRSYTQATRNAHDGLSVVQAGEAALGQQAALLTRLRELAMQSASDGVGQAERGYLDREAQRTVAELQRISQVTEFNGTRLLAGAAVTLDFQVGLQATASDVISLRTLDATTAVATPDVTGPATAATAAPGAPAFFGAAATAYQAALAPGGWLDSVARPIAQAAAAATTNGVAAQASADAAHQLFHVGYMTVDGPGGFGDPPPAGPARDAAVALVGATAGGGAAGNVYLTAAFAAYARAVAGGSTPLAAEGAALGAAAAVPGGTGQIPTTASLAAGLMFRAAWAGVTGAAPPAGALPAGAALDAGLATLGFSYVPGAITPGTTGGLGVRGLSLGSKPTALAALSLVDGALGKVSAARAELGATGSRLQSAISAIQSFSQSLAAANSRIKDVDVAEETGRLARAQILAQAGVSVLVQANQGPQRALKLLG
jgi:flagellin